MEQWKRICLLMQGTGLGSLVQKDSTCCRTTKPMGHSYWASTLQPVKRNCWAPRLQLLKSDRLESVLCNKRSHHSEKPQHGNEEESPLTTTREGPRSSEDPAQPNIKKKKKYWTPRTRWCIHSRVEETQGITGSFPSPLSLHLTHKPTPWLHPECGDNKREGGWVLPGRYRAWASVNPRRGGETFRMLQGGKQEEGREGRSSGACWMLLGCAFCWRLGQYILILNTRDWGLVQLSTDSSGAE